MKRLDDIIAEVRAVADRPLIEDFIARGWVRPRRDAEDYIFEEIDIARIRLVCELRDDMALDSDAVDIVLSLLDQLHSVRQRMNLFLDLLEEQPDTVRRGINKSLRARYKGL